MKFVLKIDKFYPGLNHRGPIKIGGNLFRIVRKQDFNIGKVYAQW